MSECKPTTIVPLELGKEKLVSLIDLIEKGGEVERRHIEALLPNALMTVIVPCNDTIISTATIKVSRDSYRKRVFGEAGVSEEYSKYSFELGYVVTDESYRRKGHCKAVMFHIMNEVKGRCLFATTRKPEMMKLLNEFGFRQVGKEYKDGLFLFLYN